MIFLVTLSATNVKMYQYTARMKQLFEEQEKVQQVDEFWKVNSMNS